MKRTLVLCIATAALGLGQQFPEVPNYEAMKIPADNPMTVAKVELGKQLYYDKRLSGDGTKACYSCHLKEKGLTLGEATGTGPFGAKLTRSAPTMWNVGYLPAIYWDGRAPTLERQVIGAWTGANMGVSGKDGRPSTDDIAKKLNELPGYRQQFQSVFGGPATPDNVAKALAAFMRTIVATKERSAWMRFMTGDKKALSAQAQRGYKVFHEKAKCDNCHDGKLLSDMQFHNVGIGMDAPTPDLGRFVVTKDEKDKGAFKNPTLLDISKSAPYFHNGSVATLDEAVDIMVNGGKDNPWLDKTNLKPVKLTKQERADLMAFLKSLDVTYDIAEPKLP
ncbi:MAG TPA: cytochrome c peroxidase [Bryobacteraceae bacterium]|nr:cytochrome c peroxidase [Bryobacteraceae bacterium]